MLVKNSLSSEKNVVLLRAQIRRVIQEFTNNKQTIHYMKKETEKKTYEAPRLTAVTFKAERGYADSGMLGLGLEHQSEGSQSIEDRGDATTWSW